jgi:hypothetical protein
VAGISQLQVGYHIFDIVERLIPMREWLDIDAATARVPLVAKVRNQMSANDPPTRRRYVAGVLDWFVLSSPTF